jgi:hypothetical protein
VEQIDRSAPSRKTALPLNLNLVHHLLNLRSILGQLLGLLPLIGIFYRALQGQHAVLGVVANMFLVQTLGNKNSFVVAFDPVVDV